MSDRSIACANITLDGHSQCNCAHAIDAQDVSRALKQIPVSFMREDARAGRHIGEIQRIMTLSITIGFLKRVPIANYIVTNQNLELD